jgi:connector enhancer of kinase suppressor of Ras 2
VRHFRDQPIESLELLTPNKTKSLTLKKKNSLMNKRRKVSLKTLCTSDIQGHLYRRAKDKNGLAFWAKHYFVLIDTALYGFKKKESTKANSLIFLSGFTVSLATEVHSKPFAFKVYHQLKSFYFAAETNEALNQWMEFIRQATLKGTTNVAVGKTGDYNIKELYSETESDDDDEFLTDVGGKNLLCTPSPLAHSSNQPSRSESNEQASTPTTTKNEKYHLNFGSLKKFTKTSLPFSTENGSHSEGNKFFNFFSHKNVEKSNSSELPVPTASFRSYRKVPGHSGLQIGTNSASTEKISVPLTPIPLVENNEPPPVPPQSAKPSPTGRRHVLQTLIYIVP